MLWRAPALSTTATSLRRRTRLGQLWVGATMLALATSLPEVATDISAVRIDAPDLAAGDLFGSSMANMLIFAVLSLWFARLWRNHRFGAVEWMTWVIALVVAAEAMLFILFDTGLQLFRVGPGGLVIVATYIVGARIVFLRSAAAGQEIRRQELVTEAAVTDPVDPAQLTLYEQPLWKTFALFFAWSVVVVVAAPFLANAAAELAEITGLGDSFFGVIGLAILTSLPEMASSYAAFRRGLPSMVLGNLLGSNGFNMIILLPVDIAYTKSPLLQSIQRAHALAAFEGLLMMVAVIGGVFLLSRLREGPGRAALIATAIIYLGGMYSIYALTT